MNITQNNIFKYAKIKISLNLVWNGQANFKERRLLIWDQVYSPAGFNEQLAVIK